MTRMSRLGTIMVLIVLGCAAIIAVFPLVWLISTSLKGSSDVFAVPPQLIPMDPTLDSYFYVWGAGEVDRYLLNSLVIAGGTVLLNVACATVAGYALARLPFRGTKLYFAVVIGTMLIPFPAITLALFGVSRSLGLYGTPLGVILPLVAIFLWLSVYIMKEAFAALPKELEEAAFIDGAGPLRTFFAVMLPLVKAPMSTAAILVFTLTWSEFLWPLLMLREPEQFPVSVGLQYFMSALTSNWHHIAAVAVLASVPTVVLFLSLQRFFFRGHLSGATKG